MAILTLNKSTVKLITSTQIITSVSSVVKELVENSLDANAKNIDVNLSDNGLSMIEIRDDGSGVSVTDIPNVALPHSTSKISEFADLDSLNTYGFRGEALNAICKVAAQVTVTTKTSRDETAKIYTLDSDGNIIDTELSPRLDGTTVRVKKLFDNIPVRRQIIGEKKKSKQDIKYIEILLKNLSVSNPTVRIGYRVNSCLIFLKPSCDNFKEALSHFLGSKIVANLESINYEDSEMKIQLMIPKKEVTELHLVYESNEQYLIVNKRPVKYKQLEKIMNERISNYFGSKAPPKKRAIYFLNITVSPDDIDVNLEPNKTCVLLKNQDTISKKLDNMLLEFYNLGDENMKPEISSMNTSIDTSPEYQDSSHSLKMNDIETPPPPPPACKKIKLNNNREKARDFIVDFETTKRKGKTDRIFDVTPSQKITRSKPQDLWKDGTNIVEDIRDDEKIGRFSDQNSIDKIIQHFSGPDLSDSDGETNVATAVTETAIKVVGHAARSRNDSIGNENFELGSKVTSSKNSESFALSPDNENGGKIFDDRNAEAYPSEIEEESISQLPVVDLGEDFDIEAILEKSGNVLETRKSVDRSIINEDNNQLKEVENIERPKMSLELWSKGQIPGLKGSTDVSMLNDSKMKAGSSKDNQSKLKDANTETIYHTGFSKFSHEIRSQVLEENPGATLPTIGKIFANRWKELSPEERGYYRDLALEEKRRLEKDKKLIKTIKLSEQEAEKNKARLVQMLETMKKSKPMKKCSFNERTAIQWQIGVQNITENFFTKQTFESDRIIGRLTDEIWAVKSDEKISVINSSEILKEVKESRDPEEHQNILTNDNCKTILSTLLREKKINESFFHPIHSIVVSSSID